MKIRIEPYKTWSGGAKRLGHRAGILRATPKQVQKHGDFGIIINWGRSERRFEGEYINDPQAVTVASDKLKSIQAFHKDGVPQPDFTTDRDRAGKWLSEGRKVFARTLLRASGGRGLTLVDPVESTTLPKAPLYTTYVPKKDEYRVHVWKGEVIDVQQKRRNTDIPDSEVNWQIRNHSNGFIFARDNVNAPASVLNTACSAVSALLLDFGAVDLGWNEQKQECVVYEVNTAPGLEGSTLDAYYGALIKTYPMLKTGMYAKRRAARGI